MLTPPCWESEVQKQLEELEWERLPSPGRLEYVHAFFAAVRLRAWCEPSVGVLGLCPQTPAGDCVFVGG